MTDKIERCLCGGDVECLSGETTLTSWLVCGWCDYESTTFETPTEAIATHNRMMLAARAPAEDIDALRRHAAAMTTQADLAHQALLDERRQWETERQQWEDKQAGLQVQSDAYWRQLQQAAEHLDEVIAAHKQHLNELIAAHKQQIAELTDAIAPVEWPPGRVPTEPGWYLFDHAAADPEIVSVDEHRWIRDREALHYYASWKNSHPGQWLGPVVLPRKRGGK